MEEFVKEIPKLCCQVNPYTSCSKCHWALCRVHRSQEKYVLRGLYDIHNEASPDCCQVNSVVLHDPPTLLSS